MARLNGLVALMLSLPSWMLAQSDSLLVDSVASHPTLRVRSFAQVSQIDSIWSDSLWVWNGACDGPFRSFRFEFPDSTFCAIEIPCSQKVTEPSDLNARLTTASGISESQAWTAELLIGTCDIEALPRKPLSTSCFPPAVRADFEELLSAMERAVFETEKCSTLIKASENLCLTRDQMRQALSHIPSEDRRLETLERITPSGTEWTEVELKEMFQLNFILERALKRFTKR
jgi:hypothetical protein